MQTADHTRRRERGGPAGCYRQTGAAQTEMSSSPPRACDPPLDDDRCRSPSERARSLPLPAVTGRGVSYRVLSATFGALATAAGAPPGDPTGGGTKGFGTCIRGYYSEFKNRSTKNIRLSKLFLCAFDLYFSFIILLYDFYYIFRQLFHELLLLSTQAIAIGPNILQFGRTRAAEP